MGLTLEHKISDLFWVMLTVLVFCTIVLEVVYHLTSMELNHSLVVKARCDRDNPEVPSLYSLFRGADYQEREIYDLIGIEFTGHPNMKRLFMWEGFEGHPLRRDYL